MSDYKEFFEIARLFVDYMEADSHCNKQRRFLQEGNKTSVIFSDVTHFFENYSKNYFFENTSKEDRNSLAYLLFACLREFFISIFDVSYDRNDGDLLIRLKNEPLLDELMTTLFIKKYNYIIDQKLREEFEKAITPLTSPSGSPKNLALMCNGDKYGKKKINGHLNKTKIISNDIEKLFEQSVHFQ
uniref:Uncharacterized protein n=1 Tax=Meloidogyne enterolobii TaxID=390850 RepID=A0A6V7TMZ9_MELEN|nr:unnamed protein product [Meloidogyne enterolobii]